MKYTILAAAIFGSSVASALQPDQAQNAVITATRILTITHEGRPVTVTSLETLFPETSINLEARVARPTGGLPQGHVGGQHFEMGGGMHAGGGGREGAHGAGRGHSFGGMMMGGGGGGGGGAGHAVSGVGLPVSQGPPMMMMGNQGASAQATGAPTLQDRARHEHESKKGKNHHHTKGRGEGHMDVGEAMVTGGGQQAAATGGAMRGGKHHGGKHDGKKEEGGKMDMKMGGEEMPLEKMHQRRFSSGGMPGGAAFVGAAPSGGAQGAMMHGGGRGGQGPASEGGHHMMGQFQHAEKSGGREEKRLNAAEIPLKFLPKQHKREADDISEKVKSEATPATTHVRNVSDTPMPTFVPGRFHGVKKGNHTIHGGKGGNQTFHGGNGTFHHGGNKTNKAEPSRKGSPKALTPIEKLLQANKTPVEDPLVTEKPMIMDRGEKDDTKGDVKTVHEHLTLTTKVRKPNGA